MDSREQDVDNKLVGLIVGVVLGVGARRTTEASYGETQKYERRGMKASEESRAFYPKQCWF
ncbi:Uncharacterised protein [Candidatus Gugararchaeum adminiculabundum]|nr:Uncharacterised protein [Candidatus Gugararchaeum adminiculabundum]